MMGIAANFGTISEYARSRSPWPTARIFILPLVPNPEIVERSIKD
jgi:hypothetical protein